MNKLLFVSEYWKNLFGERVHRIPVDAGFTCPNRDGTKGVGGCIFCDEVGSRARYVEPELPVREQVLSGRERLKKRGVNKFIVYFQAYTNTYAPPEILKILYTSVLDINGVVGISISTRPDCLQPEILDIIEEMASTTHLWLEIGVQTVNDSTLKLVNRHHTTMDSMDAIIRAKKRKGINVLAHVIIGLPGEDDQDFIKTARAISDWGIDGVKLHHLYVVKNTVLARMYSRNEVKVFETPEEYAEKAILFLKNLREGIIIHRLSGYAHKDYLIAPEWTAHRGIADRIIREYFSKG